MSERWVAPAVHPGQMAQWTFQANILKEHISMSCADRAASCFLLPVVAGCGFAGGLRAGEEIWTCRFARSA